MLESARFRQNTPKNANFPCIFPVNREFPAETSSLETACTARHFRSVQKVISPASGPETAPGSAPDRVARVPRPANRTGA